MFNLFHKTKKKWLNLMEIIVMIVVLALLVGLAIPKLANITKDASVTALYRDIDTLEKAVEMYYVQNDKYPVLEKLDLTETNPQLLASIQSTGDTGKTLYRLDLDEIREYHTRLKYGQETEDKYFIYSVESNRVYYTKGLTNSDGEIIYGFTSIPVRNISLGGTMLTKSKPVNIVANTYTLKGETVQAESVAITLNGEEVPVTYENIEFASYMKNIYAADTYTKVFKAQLTFEPNKKYNLVVRTSAGDEKYTIQSSGSGNSNETSYSYFNNATQRFKNFVYTWSNKTAANPYTISNGASVEIPFIGTGADVEMYVSSKGSTRVDVYVDGVQHPSINLSQETKGYQYIDIAKNLPHGEHVIKLVNKTVRELNIHNIRVHNDNDSVITPDLSGTIENHANTLYLNSVFGMQKYIIYRSKNPNIDINNAYAYDIIETTKTTTSSNVEYVAAKHIKYTDITHDNEPYYYRVMGIDSGGYRWISNEIKINTTNVITHNNLIANNRLTFKNFVYTWGNKTAANPYTTSNGASVEIPFIGTGADVEMYVSSKGSTRVDVYVDGVQHPSINLSQETKGYQYINIVRNLPHGEHVIKLVNKTTRELNIRNVRTYTTYTPVNSLNLTTSIENHANTLYINNAFGFEKYLIYRSKDSNMNTSIIAPYDTIYNTKTTTNANILYAATEYIKYTDLTHDMEPYYYKVIALDSAGNKYISNEVSIIHPSIIVHNNLITNNRLTFKNFIYSWSNKTAANPYTTSNGASVEIPFIGTGADVEMHVSSKGSTRVDVYVDGVQHPSINLSQETKGYQYINIAKNLPHGEHVIKLVNKTARELNIRNVKTYTN
ncbi:hypothetical protein [Alkaliphilus sp. B6464]|uniref:hypothetical protein n=1 Tax=Alkaliphilus sp. B6464 TaxID=2731219 RepID=UPI001BA915F8|nr:hypothetical protein [Alkaliphilus sp. B6464]QUH21884.1 hypothetical protein HYG84_18280 [Alkaliphilus sp. B6464]